MAPAWQPAAEAEDQGAQGGAGCLTMRDCRRFAGRLRGRAVGLWLLQTATGRRSQEVRYPFFSKSPARHMYS